jgi:fermentation-respiration switch protein FrsA (DUF1100 family)
MTRVLIIAAVVVAGLLFVLLNIWTLQRRLMYFPAAAVPAPAEVGLDGVEPVTFGTTDGLQLNGWFVATPSPRATILVFNGNAGNRAYRGSLARAFRRRGFQVLLFDYRGYGGNPGRPTEAGLAEDSRAVRNYLVSRPDVDASRVIYFGESLGAAVAVRLAVDHPPAALVLRSPFTSMADVGQHHYPILPVGLLLRDRFDAIDQIRRVRVPLLVIAGDQDRIVPTEHSRRLYEAAPGPKTMFVMPGADHNDAELAEGDEMIDAVTMFLAPLLE